MTRRPGQARAPVILAALVFASVRPGAANAQGPPSGPATVPSALSLYPPSNPESVDKQLIDAAARPAGLLKHGPVSILDPLLKQFNRATEDFGLKVGLAYTVVYQTASEGPGRRDAAGGDIDLFGDWRLLGRPGGENNGYLYFAAENRQQIGTPIAPGALKGEVGSLWGTTNGFGEQVLTMKELFWQQHFGGDRLIVRAGKLDPENYYNSNYWQSDSKYFMNQAFSSFPVRAFPGNGLGVNLTSKFSDQWYVSTGVQDAQGKKTEAGFDTFFEDFNLFGAFEVGFTPVLEDVGRGTYRFTAWYRDAGTRDGRPHDAGFDVSIDQRVGPHLIPFIRAGTGQGNINGIEHMISAGVGWEGSLLTESDVMGFAAAWGRPSNHDLDDQFATEVFYRLQVSPDNQLTVGYQVIFNPSNAPDDHVVGVFEIRWRVAM
jgi:porin